MDIQYKIVNSRKDREREYINPVRWGDCGESATLLFLSTCEKISLAKDLDIFMVQNCFSKGSQRDQKVCKLEIVIFVVKKQGNGNK